LADRPRCGKRAQIARASCRSALGARSCRVAAYVLHVARVSIAALERASERTRERERAFAAFGQSSAKSEYPPMIDSAIERDEPFMYVE